MTEDEGENYEEDEDGSKKRRRSASDDGRPGRRRRRREPDNASFLLTQYKLSPIDAVRSSSLARRLESKEEYTSKYSATTMARALTTGKAQQA